MCLCLMIAVISIQTWNRQIYRPLYQLLIEAFDHMEKNDFSYRIEVQNENDFFIPFMKSTITWQKRCNNISRRICSKRFL